MKKLSFSNLGGIGSMTTVLLAGALGIIGCARQVPPGDIPVIYELAAWPHQDLVTVERVQATVIPGQYDPKSRTTLLSFRIQGTLQAEPGSRPVVTAVHVSESLYPDACHYLAGEDTETTWTELRLTPIVELHPDPEHSGLPEPFDVSVKKRVSLQHTSVTELNIVSQHRTTTVELVSARFGSTESPTEVLVANSVSSDSSLESEPSPPAIGTAAPFSVQETDPYGRWFILCQPREDTNGDGVLGVGDSAEPSLVSASGQSRRIDHYLGEAQDGDLVAYTREGEVFLLDARSDEWVSFDGVRWRAFQAAERGRRNATCSGWEATRADAPSPLFRRQDGTILAVADWAPNSIEANVALLAAALDEDHDDTRPPRLGPLYWLPKDDEPPPLVGRRIEQEPSTKAPFCAPRIGHLTRGVQLPKRFRPAEPATDGAVAESPPSETSAAQPSVAGSPTVESPSAESPTPPSEGSAETSILPLDALSPNDITAADELLRLAITQRPALFAGVHVDALVRRQAPWLGPAALRVYFDDAKLEASLEGIAAQALRAGWLDLDASQIFVRAAVALLNQVAIARGHDVRLSLLENSSGTRLSLLFAPEAAHCASTEQVRLQR